jgi:NAD(P)-dependent dehydrogenase (short-subunit alcohol dehydrogenase family)
MNPTAHARIVAPGNQCAPGNAKGTSLSGCADDCSKFSIGESIMSQRTWFITGVSSGFGRQLTDQLLERGDCVVGTVRDTGRVADLLVRYPEAFHAEVLDVTDTAGIREVVNRSFARRVTSTRVASSMVHAGCKQDRSPISLLAKSGIIHKSTAADLLDLQSASSTLGFLP